MKGFWKYFWIIYILFFAIPFPMFIYYMTAYATGVEGANPWLALIYLAGSVILWIALLLGWFRKWVLLNFIMQKNILRLLKDGARKEARIIKSKELASKGHDLVTKEIVCTLRNFSGTEITQQLIVNDSQPALRRYDEGKTVQLRIDEKLKAVPYIIPDGVQVSINRGWIVLLCIIWLIVAAAVVGYYIFSYQLENNGTGWRFLKFYHPLVLIPLILLFTRLGLMKLLQLFGNSPEKELQLKYYGLRTEAQIVSASQTGTYINDQPQIRFELRYQDSVGVSHTVTLKKIVPLIDLGSVKDPAVAIFYLKEKPEQVIFASDIAG
jgi:hypothetical protein